MLKKEKEKKTKQSNNNIKKKKKKKENNRKNSKDISVTFSGDVGSVGSRPRRFLCLASSVCWSLQCLISALTQGGGGGHFVVVVVRLTC